MARESKEGIDYFPLDIDIFEDHKILLAQELIDPSGQEAFKRLLIPYISVRLLREIYRNGYYIEWNNAQCLTMASKIGNGITMNLLNEYTNCLIKSGFFSEDIYNKFNILTSRGVQKRWVHISKNANRKKFIVIEEYKLLTFEKKISLDILPKSLDILPKSTEETPAGRQEMQQINVSFPFNSNKDIGNDGNKENNIIITNKEDKEVKSIDISPKSTEETAKSLDISPKSTEETAKSLDISPKSTEETAKSTEEIILTAQDLQLLAGTSDEFKAIWQDWENYRWQEHKKKYNSLVSRRSAIEELTRLSEYDEIRAIQILKTSMAQQWTGFYFKKDTDSQRVASQNGKTNSSILSGDAPIEQQLAHYQKKKRN